MALAQEVESNHERYNLVRREERRQENFGKNTKQYKPQKGEKNPYYSSNVQQFKNNQNTEPMDIDPSSSKFRQATQYKANNQQKNVEPMSVDQSTAKFQYNKRNAYSDRQTGPKMQRLNHLIQENETEYDTKANEACEGLEDEESWNTDQVNFLGENPSCRS